MRKNILLVIIISLLKFNSSYAQWTKIATIPTQEIVALASVDNTIFAASGTNLLYKSTDGISWNSITVSNLPIDIITLKIIDSKIYIGTFSQGILTSIDFGLTWKNTSTLLFPISGFDKKNGNVYASTLGSGVFVENLLTNNWSSFNNSLPSNTSYNVQTIKASSTSLIIGAGANGAYYSYDFSSNQWIQDYYYGLIAPGLIIDKIISNSETLFAVSGNRILRSSNGGLNWIDDKIGSRNGNSRTIYLGTQNYYTLTNLLSGGTWIQQRNINATVGTTWVANEEFIKTGYSYDIIEFQNKLFLAKDDGLYSKELVLGIENPTRLEVDLKIFPNPSNAENINISSTSMVNTLTISNSLGQIIYAENIFKNDFQIQQNFSKGLYLMKFELENGENILRKIIIN